MWNDLGSCQLFGGNPHHLPSNWLSAAEYLLRHCRRGNRLVGVIHIMNVRDVRNVGYIRHVANIGDVYHVQVIAAVVIPGKEGLSRSQREPPHYANANRES